MSYRRFSHFLSFSRTRAHTYTHARTQVHALSRHCVSVCVCPLSRSPSRASVSFVTDEWSYRWRAIRGNGSNFVIYIGICKYRRYAARCRYVCAGPEVACTRAYAGVACVCACALALARASVFINDKSHAARIILMELRRDKDASLSRYPRFYPRYSLPARSLTRYRSFSIGV